MLEEWMPVHGYRDMYEVSSEGRVRRKLKHGGYRYLKPTNNSCGYPSVGLSYEYGRGKTKSETVHKLVATAFLPNPNGLPQVNHKDGNKTNNNLSNLEWCSASANVTHAWDIGLREKAREKARVTLKNLQPLGIIAHVKNKSKKIEVIRIETGERFVFKSANDAARALGVQQGNLSACCNGRIRQTCGFTAKYL